MCWGKDPEDYKDVYHEGVVNLFGACEIGDKGGKEEYTIGKVFWNKQARLIVGRVYCKMSKRRLWNLSKEQATR